jgi:hypothetical protein
LTKWQFLSIALSSKLLPKVYSSLKINWCFILFHRGDSSQKARDLHVLQQLRTELLHDVSATSFDLLMDIRHASIVNQGLDLLLECRHLVDPNAFVQCLDSVVSQYSKAEALDAESRLLLSRCRILSRLARLYIHLKAMQSLPPDYDAVVNASHVSLQVNATATVTKSSFLNRLQNRQCISFLPRMLQPFSDWTGTKYRGRFNGALHQLYTRLLLSRRSRYIPFSALSSYQLATAV